MNPSEHGYTSQNFTRSLPISFLNRSRYGSNLVPPWTISRRSGHASATVAFPVTSFSRANSTYIHAGMPLSAVIGSCALSWANRRTFSSQSVMSVRSPGGNVYGRRNSNNSFAAIPLRSPARLPSACRRRSVLPPRKKNLPVNSFAAGLACRNSAVVVNPAFLFDRTMSHDTGMYFVAPLVVPEESA